MPPPNDHGHDHGHDHDHDHDATEERPSLLLVLLAVRDQVAAPIRLGPVELDLLRQLDLVDRRELALTPLGRDLICYMDGGVLAP